MKLSEVRVWGGAAGKAGRWELSWSDFSRGGSAHWGLQLAAAWAGLDE